METITVYKLFRFDICLHPLFIDRSLVLPTGKWLDARAPDISMVKARGDGYYLIDMKDNHVIIYDPKRKPRPNDIICATADGYRWMQAEGPRLYDLGIGSNGYVLRFAHRPGWHSSATPSLPGVNMDGKVWAECQIPADDYYILRRNVSGLSKTHEPIEWYISQKLLIVRVLP